MENKILEILKLKTDGYISGEELSKLLKVSRTAIWKHIENLRRDGYVVEAHPHLGYRLAEIPDRLLPDEIRWRLKTKKIGKKVYSYNTLDSTNETAYRLAEEDCPEGALIIAEEQKKGKGRLGRSWVSPKDAGIYFSCVLRPNIGPNEAAKMTLISAVSVVKAIRAFTSLECLIRWPNDILVNSKKICGILTEMKAEQDKVLFLVIGIGVNVNTSAALLPKEATSIKETVKYAVSRIDLAKRILEELDENYHIFLKQGFQPFVDEWERYSAITGKRVKVLCNDKAVEGTARNIDDDGALVVRLDNGFLKHVLAGDVTLLR